MNERLDKIKTHLKENKTAYIVGAAGVVAGAVVGGVVVYIVAKSNTASISTEIHGNENVVTNIVVNLQRRMHPGYKVACNETGEVFASINRTAEVMGLSPRRVSEQLRGLIPDVNGHTFVNLGEMQ
jgi:hypothetical protein